MKNIFSELRRALVSTAVLLALCCGLYPLVVYGLAQAAFPAKANGSLIAGTNGTVRGSRLIGQNFTAPQYFHPRPSAAGNGYDAASSGGSNLGPTSRKLRDLIRDRVAAYRAENGLGPDVPVPADAVTASASGLDPHISPANAQLQIARVAKARNVPSESVAALRTACTKGPQLAVFGEPVVDVLQLNLALDEAASTAGGHVP